MDTAKLELAAKRYKEAVDALEAARVDLRAEAVAALQQGAAPAAPADQAEVARVTGFSGDDVMALAAEAAA
ncbi:hypothetical protein [Streptomyces montanisoli]|uniref:Uncharacterized protein n=1 Tax=Streptomyces montanisoli TaxID=2798581 RepID=A0A940MFT5_9ACTN|nr:hypothetical protein [Streptomyces montanisoli]MBP0458386.1 hypothetical protein [Streptomyces montanisoli]